MDRQENCLIISGGAFVDLQEDALKADYVIACDAGLDHADRYGISPDVTVGDFDSVSEGNKKKLLSGEIKNIRYPAQKDDTDTSIAIKHALNLGFKDIRMVCALGNRMDHTIANIQTAHYGAVHGATVRIFDEGMTAVIFSDSSITVEKKEGYGLSVFSLSDESRGVTLSGTKYTLDNGIISNSFAIGQSNEFLDDLAGISVKEGVLMVIISRL